MRRSSSTTQKRKAIAQKVKRHIAEEMALAVADVVLLGTGEAAQDHLGQAAAPRKTREQYMHKTLGTEGVRTLGSARRSGSRSRGTS